MALSPLSPTLDTLSFWPAATTTCDVIVHMVLRCNVWSPVLGMLQTETGAERHAFEFATQNNPVELLQLADPQTQSFVFTKDPSAEAQIISWPHWFDELWQNNPVVVSHSLDPQVQLLLFFVVPSTTSHTGMTLAEH